MGCSSSNRIKATDVSVQTGHPFLWLVVARPVFVICYFYCTHDNNAAGCTTLSCTGLRTGLAWPALAASAASQGPTQWKRLYSQLRLAGWLVASAIVSSGNQAQSGATFSIMNGAAVALFTHSLFTSFECKLVSPANKWRPEN